MKIVSLLLFSSLILSGNQETPVNPSTKPEAPAAPATAVPDPAPVPAKPVVIAPDFHREVRGILESTCVSCHGADSQKGGLRLDTLAYMKKGGDSGPAIIPGNKEESILLERIHLPADDEEIMPPKNGPLSADYKDILDRWVVTGATWPKGVQLKEISERELVLRNKSQNKQLVSIAAYPKSITLKTQEDFNSVVLVATYSDDVTRDVTFESSMWLENSAIADFRDKILYPKQQGETKLLAEFEGKRIEVPVVVTEPTVPRPVSFKLDVMPVFMKAGCNTGSCHGSARGQDRFMLSLFGYDPEGDHYRITREQGTRRINLAIPEESMLVEKAIGTVPHTGGKLFGKDSRHWKTLVDWLKDGASKDPKDIAKPTNIELFPPSALLEGEGATQQMTVLAHYSDGTTRDVTPLTVFQSSNDVSAAVDEKGMVTAGSRGEAFMMARFNIFTVGIPMVVIPEDLKYQRPQLPANNYVDYSCS
jgi:hypothetical protein